MILPSVLSEASSLAAERERQTGRRVNGNKTQDRNKIKEEVIKKIGEEEENE